MSENTFTFENLSVYQKAISFANVVYDITSKFPSEERFILVDQFMRYLKIARRYGRLL